MSESSALWEELDSAARKAANGVFKVVESEVTNMPPEARSLFYMRLADRLMEEVASDWARTAAHD